MIVHCVYSLSLFPQYRHLGNFPCLCRFSYFKEELRKCPSWPTNPCRYKPLLASNHFFKLAGAKGFEHSSRGPAFLAVLAPQCHWTEESPPGPEIQLHPHHGARAPGKILIYLLASLTVTFSRGGIANGPPARMLHPSLLLFPTPLDGDAGWLLPSKARVVAVSRQGRHLSRLTFRYRGKKSLLWGW